MNKNSHNKVIISPWKQNRQWKATKKLKISKPNILMFAQPTNQQIILFNPNRFQTNPTILRQWRRNLAPFCSNTDPNVYSFICSIETRLLFHFQGCLANLISGMRTIQNLNSFWTRKAAYLAVFPGFSIHSCCFWFSVEFLGVCKTFDCLSSDYKRFQLNFQERGNSQLEVSTTAKAKFCINFTSKLFSFFNV